jgi:hypothetical protein
MIGSVEVRVPRAIGSMVSLIGGIVVRTLVGVLITPWENPDYDEGWPK